MILGFQDSIQQFHLVPLFCCSCFSLHPVISQLYFFFFFLECGLFPSFLLLSITNLTCPWLGWKGHPQELSLCSLWSSVSPLWMENTLCSHCPILLFLPSSMLSDFAFYCIFSSSLLLFYPKLHFTHPLIHTCAWYLKKESVSPNTHGEKSLELVKSPGEILQPSFPELAWQEHLPEGKTRWHSGLV